MLKKPYYKAFKNKIVIELQKNVEGIFNLKPEKFKAK